MLTIITPNSQKFVYFFFVNKISKTHNLIALIAYRFCISTTIFIYNGSEMSLFDQYFAKTRHNNHGQNVNILFVSCFLMLLSVQIKLNYSDQTTKVHWKCITGSCLLYCILNLIKFQFGKQQLTIGCCWNLQMSLKWNLSEILNTKTELNPKFHPATNWKIQKYRIIEFV